LEHRTLERSQRFNGFDYWIGRDDLGDLFRHRLEVSGILTGDPATVDTRMRQKSERLPLNDQHATIQVIDVEFSEPMAMVTRR
jgi:hypothetical protein